MEYQAINVRKLSEELELSSIGEDLLSLLSKEDDFQLDAEICRERLKRDYPAVKNISYNIKNMQKKGLILILYAPDGKKFIRLSQEGTLENISASGEAISKRAKKLSKETIEEVKKEILNCVESSEGVAYKSDIYEYISGLFPGITFVQFTNILKEMEIANILFKKLVMSKDSKRGMMYHSVPTENSEAAVAEAPPTSYDENRVIIDLRPEDVELLYSALKYFRIVEAPKVWIKERVEDIILNLSERKIHLNDIVFDDNFILKYMWLKEDFEEKDKSHIENEIKLLLTDYIDGEYNKRYVYNQFSEIISQSTDPKVLSNVKSLIDRKLRDLAEK